jgi:hypothetical protein
VRLIHVAPAGALTHSRSPETESVIVVLRGEELDDISHVAVSQQELICGAFSEEPEVNGVSFSESSSRTYVNLSTGVSQEFEMEDLSGSDAGRWKLSWHIGVVDDDESSAPSPVQSDDILDDERLHLTGL